MVLPGVQVLMAFLLTAPFARGSATSTTSAGAAYFVALISALGSIDLSARTDGVPPRRRAHGSPGATGVGRAHRGGRRRPPGRRADGGDWCIMRLVFGTPAATVVAAVAVGAFVGVWVVLPISVGRTSRGL